MPRSTFAEAPQVLEAAAEGFAALDREFRLEYMNATGERLCGAARGDLLGKMAWEVFPAAMGSELEGMLRRAMADKTAGACEHQVAPTGAWLSLRVSPAAADGAAVWFSDITERKRTEAALRESERREHARVAEMEALMDAAPVAILVTQDAECRQIGGNRMAYELLRRPPGSNLSKSAPADSKPGNFRIFRDGSEIRAEDLPVQMAASSGRRIQNCELDLVFEDGACVNLLGNAVPMLDENGQPRGAVGAFVDITDRKQAEEALKRSEWLHRALGESIDYGVWVCGPDGRNTYASESFLKLVGMTQEQCSDFGWGKVLHPDDAERTIAAWKECVKTEGHWDIEHRYRGVDGQWHPILARGVPVRDERGQTICWAGINLDISAQKRAEAALRESTERMELAAEAADFGTFYADLSAGTLHWSRGMWKVLGLAEDAPVPPFRFVPDFVHPDDRQLLSEAIARALDPRGGGVVLHEHRIVRPDGSVRWVQRRGRVHFSEEGETRRPIRYSGVVLDITDRKKAEEQRQELAAKEQRLATEKSLRAAEAELARIARGLTVGELATSIAHEVNQPLAGVITNAEAGLRWLGGRKPNLGEVRESLALVVRDAQRASDIIRRIREFTRKGGAPAERLDLRAAIGHAEELAHGDLLKRGVTLRTEVAVDLAPVQGDHIQLEQVLLNLIMNGAEAMAALDGRRELLITAHNWCAPRGAAGVRVAVRDCGAGIAPEDMPRMFDPFFTSKPDGIGMGLPICRSIVEAHGGRIWAEANSEAGLTVQFTLPAEREDAP